MNKDRKYFEKDFYEETDYFSRNVDVFANLNSRFQKYRISTVFSIYNPRPDEVVLDIGTGWGTFPFALSGKVKKVIGLDIAEKSIEFCKRIAEERNIKDIEFVAADARNTNLPENSIDTIICADLFEHLYPDIYMDTIKEALRILTPGGKFIIWTPNPGHIIEIFKRRNIIFKRDPAHVDYKTMPYLKKTFHEVGFEIEKVGYSASHTPILNIFERIFKSICPLLRRRHEVLARKPK